MHQHIRRIAIAALLLGVILSNFGVHSAHARTPNPTVTHHTSELDTGNPSPDRLMYFADLLDKESRVVGSASLYDNRDGTTTVILEAPPKWARASIHDGRYDDFDPTFRYELKDMVDGRSETVIETTLSKLLSEKRVIFLKDDSGILVFGHIPAN